METYYKSVENALRVISVFEEDSLQLTVLKNDTAWGVTVQLTALAESQNVSLETYRTNLKKYLRPPSNPNEQLTFECGQFRVVATLKNQMKRAVFQTEMLQLDFINTVYTKLDQFHSYSTELEVVKGQFHLLQQAHKDLKEKMNEFLNRHESDQVNAYNNFVAVLNEKKQQIQHLSELLAAFRSGRPTINPSPPNRVKKAQKTPVKSDFSDSDEELPKQKRFASNVRECPQPSTSKIESPSASEESEDEPQNEAVSVGNEDAGVVNFNTQELLNEL